MGLFKNKELNVLDLNEGRAEMQDKPEAKKPDTRKSKDWNDMMIEAGMKRTAKEGGWARSFEARKAQGSALLGNLWNRATGWGKRLQAGVKTGAELAKRGISGTADALFLDVGDMGSALKAKAGEKLEVAGDALHGALDSGSKRLDAWMERVGDGVESTALAGIDIGLKAYDGIGRRVTEAGISLESKIHGLQTRAEGRWQEYLDNRPAARIAKLEATVARLVAELAQQRNPMQQAA